MLNSDGRVIYMSRCKGQWPDIEFGEKFSPEVKITTCIFGST